MLLSTDSCLAKVGFVEKRHIHSNASIQSFKGHFFLKSLTWLKIFFDICESRKLEIFENTIV